jgi:tetratricopeptide (TPR) repeat protein
MEPLEPQPQPQVSAGPAMDAARIRAALAAVDELPYGRERTARREDLLAHAEGCGDLAVLASALLSLADDCQEDGENQGMVVWFGRAWRIWQTRPDVFDAPLRFRFREHFQHVVDVLSEDSRVPAAEVDRLVDQMEAFYRTGGYSLRAVHRSRYWIHRRRKETEQATRCIEALLAEDGDVGASCDACDLATAAYWYEKLDDLPRAVELWKAIIAGVRSCGRPHVGIAHGEVMIDLLNLERFDEARQHHRLGYPAIRRRRDLPRQLELHALFVNRTRDMLRGLEILHDHIDWLPEDRHAVGELWWVHGRFLLFLKLLINEGHGDLPVTRSAQRVVTASALYDELDAVLADYAAHHDLANGGGELAETLETWRTAKLRHDVLPPPADEEPEAGWAPVSAPWDRNLVGGGGAPPRSLPAGIEPVDALAARARYLSFLRHPHGCAAWERVAACGVELSDDIEAELAESRAVSLTVGASGSDHRAAHQWFEFAATLYTTRGRTGDALRCRAMAAYQVFLAGDEDAGEAAQAAAWTAAQSEFEAGRITPTQLVTVRLYGLYQRLDRWRRVVDTEPAADDEASKQISQAGSHEFRTFRELAETHGTTPQYAAGLRAWVEVTAAIGRMFAREGDNDEAAAYTDGMLDRLGGIVELYTGVFQPWFAAEAELRRGQAYLAAGQPADAERCARRAADLNSPPAAQGLLGPTALLLAESVNAQGGRDDEVAPAAAHAARLLAGADPVGAARARLLMGEVHHRAQRHAEAEAFYRPTLAGIADRWEDEACRQLIHLSALHYSISLCKLDRARDSARVLRSVLAVVPDDYATARAWLLHQLAESVEQDGNVDAAIEAYRASAKAGRRAGEQQPTAAALESAARLLAPSDLRAALRCLEDAAEYLRDIDLDDAPDGARYRDFLAAEARTLGIKHVVARIEEETISEQDAEDLLPIAQDAAEAGARELWALLDDPRDGDARAEFVTALESALKPLTLTVAVLAGDPGAAAQWQAAFAASCERWGFPEFARTAHENAAYFASHAEDAADDGDANGDDGVGEPETGAGRAARTASKGSVSG